MLVSFKWLKQYVKLPDSITPEELSLKLTMSTVEVEGVKKQSQDLEGIVIGQVKKIEAHPDADKLRVCSVDDGNGVVQVVCGGSNVSQGMKVAFAPIGSYIRWHGQGDLVELKKVKIRGVESKGMICSSTEIGLGEIFPLKNESEILDLSCLDEKPGTLLSTALGLDDVVFDIDNKSMTHRPDLWGHYGLAREVTALYGKELSEYNPPKIKEYKQRKINVKVDDHKLCPRYMAVAIDGVKIESSPDWLQKRLLAVGLRPINNIVDVTNYILLDLGQPMHAFDASHILADQIIVRRAEDGEKFISLDNKEYKLDSRDLVIADKERVVALAGVMGGENSEVSDQTNTIIFESANFDATTVRRTSTRLGLRTDSSARFEKSLDPDQAELALRRAVQMTLELCPSATIASGVVDEKKSNPAQYSIELYWDFLWKKIGVELDKKQVTKILSGLGFVIKENKEGLLVTVPTWRATKDISIAEDLVEEVARIYGYDNIEPSIPLFPIEPPEINHLRKLERQVLDILVKDLGYTEVSNHSFVSAGQIKKASDDVDKYIELDNPISKEKPYLRRNLLFGILENVVKNIEFYPELKLVEIGKTFLAEAVGVKASKNSDELLPRQDTWLSAVYANKKDQNPYWQTRRVLESLCGHLGLDFSLNIDYKLENWRHASRFGGVVINGVEMGSIYEAHPLAIQKFGLEVRVSALDINLNKLVNIVAEGAVKYQSLPEYPEVVRDLAIIVKREISHEEILKTISSVDPMLKMIRLFDVYEGKNIGEGYKSMAYHLTYASGERTLRSEEVDIIQDKVMGYLKKKLDAQVRE
ncbi:MAG: phenylalanine--tRNA ligase subunit beta [bacterium]